MNNLFPISINAIVIDCKNVTQLAHFYQEMLQWENLTVIDEDYIRLYEPNKTFCLMFQHNPFYKPPVFPAENNKQQTMIHLDFTVNSKNEMKAAVNHAISCGAVESKVQYSDKWTILFDIEGHPFCFTLWD